MRREVDDRSRSLHSQGEYILRWLTRAFQGEMSKFTPPRKFQPVQSVQESAIPAFRAIPYCGEASLEEMDLLSPLPEQEPQRDWLGDQAEPLPYTEFRRLLSESGEQDDPTSVRLDPVLS
jgi:hypothetical protein